MDSLADGNRYQLLDAVERAMQHGKNERAARERGMISLFGDMEEVQNALNSRSTQTLKRSIIRLAAWEKELMGLYITTSPGIFQRPVQRADHNNTAAITEKWTTQSRAGASSPRRVESSRKKATPMCVVTLKTCMAHRGDSLPQTLRRHPGNME